MHVEGHALRMGRAALAAGRALASVAATVDPEAARLVRRANTLVASAIELLARRARTSEETRLVARGRTPVRDPEQHARRVLDAWAAREGRAVA